MLDAGGGGGAKLGRMVTMAAPKVAGAPMPSGGGGGFTFKAEELDGVIRQWEDLRDALKTDEYDAERMATVKPPGREFASGDFTKYANPSGKAFLEANQRMQKYVDSYIEALRAAKQNITTRDEQSQSDIRRAGEQA